MKHYAIKTETDFYIHFSGADGYPDHSLCGLEMDGDESLGILPNEQTNKKVNCPTCISLIKYCKSIPSKEYKEKS